MTCPACGSSEIRVSHYACWRDYFERMCGQEAYRCRSCRVRFYASKSALSSEAHSASLKSSRRKDPRLRASAKKRFIRRLIMAVIFGTAFIIFWYFLRYLTAEPHPASDTSGIGVAPLVFSDNTFARVMYKSPSIANIQPETAGRGNG